MTESQLSISAFSRKVGYSRQYIYELLKSKDTGFSRKIQPDTLKRICDATDYGFARLLGEIGYIQMPKADVAPGSVIIVKNNGDRVVYSLAENKIGLIEELSKSLARGTD